MSTRSLFSAIPAAILSDGQAIIEAVMAGNKPDPILAQRVRERANKVTEEVLRRHGVLEIGTKAIRELRDQ